MRVKRPIRPPNARARVTSASRNPSAVALRTPDSPPGRRSGRGRRAITFTLRRRSGGIYRRRYPVETSCPFVTRQILRTIGFIKTIRYVGPKRAAAIARREGRITDIFPRILWPPVVGRASEKKTYIRLKNVQTDIKKIYHCAHARRR